MIDIQEVKNLYRSGMCVGFADGFIDGYNAGKKDAEPKWIPFSERMPDDGQDILLSGNKKVECDVWDDDLKECYRDFGEADMAWMPPPDPYEGLNERSE